MKKSCFVLFLLFILLSCIRIDKNGKSGNSVASRVKRQVTGIAIDYASGQFNDAKKTIQKDGIITIGDNQIKYIIDPARIVAGMIDNDSKEDAIVSISYYNGQFLVRTEHLFLIKTDNKFKIARVVEGDMKILKIKDRVIFAEISKVAPDAPSYGCSLCKEVVKYHYKDGDLVRME